eukprot:TRINITY_DN7933_c0_g1_i5.p1 TRINITY_DN7933_c0_g1~~TRINITY_DN7933_c0_g1_i5.p1  ORF type:complete len:193 (-),score=23.08 TRINITY_DN7933_c0_g1_i5:308-886(-)
MPEMERKSTKEMMKEYAQETPQAALHIACCSAICCFWVPLLFFIAATNLPETCEEYDTFKLWLKLYSVLPLGTFIIMLLITSLVARSGNKTLYILGLRLLLFSTSVVSLGLFIWGCKEFYLTTDDNCTDPDGFNSRALAGVFLVFGFLLIPTQCCCLCQSILNNNELDTTGDTSGNTSGNQVEVTVVGSLND